MFYDDNYLPELDDVDPIFNIGDEVIFECGAVIDGQPRWVFNDDMGSSGIFAKGKIVYIDSQIIQTEYTVDGMIGTGNCTWPNTDHPDYDPLQWWQDGYLRTLPKKRCECGSEKVYGKNTPHSEWCPKYQGV